MLNFSMHVSGPKMRALIAIANGDYRPGSSLTVNGLEREGLVHIRVVPSAVDGVTLDEPFITPRGRTVLDLIEADIENYLSRRSKKRHLPS